MREIAGDLRRLIGAGMPVALATTVQVRGSAPRPVGATLAVAADGEVVGSLSGGCVEGAVVTAATEVLATGLPVLETYGISDETAFAVGLTCGGILDVLVRRADPVVLRSLLAALELRQPVALATLVAGSTAVGASMLVQDLGTEGTLGSAGLDHAVAADARGLLAVGGTSERRYGQDGQRRVDDVTVLLQTFVPPPRLLVYGAIDFAAAVSRVGSLLGYRVTVCDARPVFATPRRFSDADEVVCAWPHDHLATTEVDARTVVCVLTHDPKFDVPLLERALRSPAGYVGAMGSRRTHDDRLARLRERGLAEAELARLHSPIGLDLGARTPEETALSIMAEVVQARSGGSGLPLGVVDGTIHHPSQPALLPA